MSQGPAVRIYDDGASRVLQGLQVRRTDIANASVRTYACALSPVDAQVAITLVCEGRGTLQENSAPGASTVSSRYVEEGIRGELEFRSFQVESSARTGPGTVLSASAQREEIIVNGKLLRRDDLEGSTASTSTVSVVTSSASGSTKEINQAAYAIRKTGRCRGSAA